MATQTVTVQPINPLTIFASTNPQGPKGDTGAPGAAGTPGAQGTPGKSARPALSALGGLQPVSTDCRVGGGVFYTGGYVGPASISSIVGDGTTTTVTFSSGHNIGSGKTATIGISGCSQAALNAVWQMAYASATTLTFPNAYNGTVATPGTACYAGVTYYRTHRLMDTVGSIRMALTNWNEGQVMTQPPAYTAKMSVYVGGKILPVYFGGQRTVTVQPGTTILSDPVGMIGSTSATTFQTLTFVTQPAGKSSSMWSTPSYLYETGDGIWQGTDETDTYTAPTFAGNNIYSFSPAVIVGTRASSTAPIVGIVGDSIMAGANDLNDAGTFKALRGYAARACRTNNYGYVTVASSGDMAKTFVAPDGSQKRLPLIQGCTHAIVGYGINDMILGSQSAAQIQASLATIYTQLKASGVKVWGAYLLPNTSSTDSWATDANQTVTRAWATYQGPVNAWMLTQVGGLLDGVIDTVSICASGPSTGKWKVNGAANYATQDGLHPSSVMHQAIAALIPTGWTA